MINIKQGIIFDSLDEVYQYYNDEVLKIVNIKQLLFYSDICGVQPDWIGRSAYDGKLIGYYGKLRTKECWGDGSDMTQLKSISGQCCDHIIIILNEKIHNIHTGYLKESK